MSQVKGRLFDGPTGERTKTKPGPSVNMVCGISAVTALSVGPAPQGSVWGHVIVPKTVDSPPEKYPWKSTWQAVNPLPDRLTCAPPSTGPRNGPGEVLLIIGCEHRSTGLITACVLRGTKSLGDR